MSKKDYFAIARIVKDISDENTRRMVTVRLATHFLADNDRFDHVRFFEACDVELPD